jgi:hypothetical protein
VTTGALRVEDAASACLLRIESKFCVGFTTLGRTGSERQDQECEEKSADKIHECLRSYADSELTS